MKKKIFVIAGDRSADLYGGLLCQHLQQKYPEFELFSCGGDNLAAHSHQIINLLAHSVSGLVEVVSSLKTMFRLFKQTYNEIERLRPNLIIVMDFPDFNLRLIKKLNKKYPVFYYISPQIWAWRKKRIQLLRRYVDKMVVIFKFEQDFYKKEGIDALYFGHPLLEIISDTPSKPGEIISFMPGSRINEIKNHLPLMIAVKSLLQKQLPAYQFRIIKPKNLSVSFYKHLPADISLTPHSYQALKESKFIIASSGTATIELAILGVPYLIVYKVNSLSWHIIKLLVKTEFAAMVNILQAKPIVKEFLQADATAENISKAVLSYLNDKIAYEKLKTDLKKTKGLLLPYGASEKFAEYIGEYLKLK